MDDATWVWAAVAIGSGLLFGEIAGRIVRTALSRRQHSSSLGELSGRIGSFVFWTATAVGLVVAVAIVDTTALEDLGDRLSESVPRFLVGLLLLIVGWAVSVAIATMVGQSARKATGVRQVALERLLQVAIMSAVVVVALTEMGVDSSMLLVLLSIAIGTPAVTIAALSAIGGRNVASQIAAGRALRNRLRTGQVVSVGDEHGEIVGLHPTSVELLLDDGTHLHVPNASMLEGSFRADR